MMIKIASTVNPHGKVWDHKGKTELVQIFISHGHCINFLHFQYVDENGSLVLSEWPDQLKSGRNFNTIKLKYPDEFITSVSGCYDMRETTVLLSNRVYSRTRCCRVTSIAFGTNKGSYGPFGLLSDGGAKFDFEMGKDRQFGGFHGTTIDGFVESIGVYVKPVANLNLLGDNVETVPRVKVEPIFWKG